VNIIKIIKENNEWLNGTVDYIKGDPGAILDAEERLDSGITKVTTIEELFRNIQNYDGIFKYKNFYFANSWKYGCFVYIEMNGEITETYFEHISINNIEKFKQFIAKLEDAYNKSKDLKEMKQNYFKWGEQ